LIALGKGLNARFQLTAGKLRENEEYAIFRVAEEFSARWRPGEDPPDAYLLLGGEEIAVEVSTLTQHVTDDSGTHPRISDDIPAVRLAKDLNDEFSEIIPFGHTIGLVLSSPILEVRKTKASLSKLLRAELANPASFAEDKIVKLNGNTITIFRNMHGEARYKKISAAIMNRNSNPDLLTNALYMISERIRTKAEKCAPFVGKHKLWLVLRNDYFLTGAHEYKLALSYMTFAHPFRRYWWSIATAPLN
jgi:hypothetical protein